MQHDPANAERQGGGSGEEIKRGSPKREDVSTEAGEVEMEGERKEEKREKSKPEPKSRRSSWKTKRRTGATPGVATARIQ